MMNVDRHLAEALLAAAGLFALFEIVRFLVQL
jgi:hypothetical protein